MIADDLVNLLYQHFYNYTLSRVFSSLSLVQFRHYKAALAVFSLKPSEESQDFADLASFIAQVLANARDSVDLSGEANLHMKNEI